MTEAPLVNIIIPTYNQVAVLGKAIESAVTQDYNNLRVIVADDCSADETPAMVAAYIKTFGDKLQYVRNKANLGRVANYRQALLKYTDGVFVVNLDGDDYYTDSGFISHAVKAIAVAGINDTLFYQGSHVWVQGDKIDEFTFQMPDHELQIMASDYLLNFYKRRYFSHMSTVYNRVYAITSGFYELDIISSDVYSFLKLCALNPEKKVIVSKRKTGNWVQANNNASSSKNVVANLQNMQIYPKLCRKMIDNGYGKVESARWASSASLHYAYSFLFC